MAPAWIIVVAGLIAGLAASLVMNLYQSVTSPLFGQGAGGEESATIKAADSAHELAAGDPVAEPHREQAGNLVHYATGAVLGIGYALLVAGWPPASAGFGMAFGLVLAVLLDDIVVPAFGWGPWPGQAGPATHAYSLSSHLVFGVALEAVRRLVLAFLA